MKFLYRIPNYSPRGRLVDPDAEFPIRYSYLLYLIRSTLSDWILAVQRLPRDLPSTKLGPDRIHSIVGAAIITLGKFARLLLEHNGLENQFRQYLLEGIFRVYFELREADLDDYAVAVQEALVRGGSYFGGAGEEHKRRIRDAFSAQDRWEYVLKYGEDTVNDFEGALAPETSGTGDLSQ